MREFFDDYKFKYTEKDTLQDDADFDEYKIAMNKKVKSNQN